MSDGETAALVAEVSADPKYVQAKTSVWWDIENCRVPRDCDPNSIAQNIISALSKMNYCGPVSISAYGDTNQIPNHVQQALSSTGVSLNHVPAGVKDASDKKILVDMLFWAVDNPAPATYLLISGDRDFSNALHQLRMRRYDILLAQPVQASAALVSAAKTAWLWTSLVAGGGPIAKSELGVNLEEPEKKCSQQGQIQDNQQLSSGSKRSPPPSISEKKSSRARTETTKSGSTQCSIIYNGPHQCYNCASSGHLSRKCTKKKRKCFLCGVDGHMRLFCNHVRPKPAQSPQQSASYNNSTLIGPAFEQSMEQKERTCFRCREEGHMVASCPQKRRLMPAQSQPASASSNKLPSNDPIEHASEDFMEPNKRRRYVTNIEGHLLSSCPQGLPIPAESQLESAFNNDLPFEQFATHNTGVTSSSQGQQLYEMPKVDEHNVPFTQASNSGPANVHGISVISDSVVPSRSP